MLTSVELMRHYADGSNALILCTDIYLCGMQGISTTREHLVELSSDSSIQPVPSPLTQVPALSSGRTEGESSAPRKRTVQAVLKRIKQEDHPKASSFFVKLVEKKERLWVDAPKDNLELTSIENKNEESQRDSNRSIDVKDVLVEEDPKKFEKLVERL
eukprot:Gb_36608 [translate_table: standard]